jgi:uncharacterized membrane protein YgdD (TMEM256/DUF423 family)
VNPRLLRRVRCVVRRTRGDALGVHAAMRSAWYAVGKEPDMTHRKLMFWGALHGALAVAMGAFAAHRLKTSLSADALNTFEVAARYQMYAALATLAMAVAHQRGMISRWPGTLMQVGAWVFSGSLYVLALTGVRGLGAVTPIGGVCFLVAWLWLAKAAWSAAPTPEESAAEGARR